MTRGDFIFELSREFGLDDTVGGDELKLMQRWYSRGVTDFLEKTRCFVDLGTMALQVGVTDYRLDTSIIVVNNITVPDATGAPAELEIVSFAEILPYLSPSVAATATPTRAAIEGSLMRIAPVPSAVVTLTYEYVPRPTDVPADGTTTNDGVDPSNVAYGGVPSEYHDGILAYMEWRAALYDDKSAPLTPKDYRVAYEGLCKDARKQNRRKAGRGLHAGRIGYPGDRGPSGRNDVYPRYAR